MENQEELEPRSQLEDRKTDKGHDPSNPYPQIKTTKNQKGKDP